MSESIYMNGIVISIVESKAECPHCNRYIPFDEFEPQWDKQNSHLMRFKCKCKRYIGITSDVKGDFIAFNLKT